MRKNGKRWTLSARTSEALNIAIKEAADRAKRSVAQEVELRLEASFRAEQDRLHIEDAVGRGVMNALMLLREREEQRELAGSSAPVAEPISSPLPSYAQ